VALRTRGTRRMIASTKNHNAAVCQGCRRSVTRVLTARPIVTAATPAVRPLRWPYDGKNDPPFAAGASLGRRLQIKPIRSTGLYRNSHRPCQKQIRSMIPRWRHLPFRPGETVTYPRQPGQLSLLKNAPHSNPKPSASGRMRARTRIFRSLPSPTASTVSDVVFAGFLCAMSRYQIDIGDAILQAYASAGARHKVGDRVALEFSFRDAVVLAE
jgi:hypothetical protein